MSVCDCCLFCTLSVACLRVLRLQNPPAHLSLICSNCTVRAQLCSAHILLFSHLCAIPLPSVWCDPLLSCHICSCLAPAVCVSPCIYSLLFVFALIVMCLQLCLPVCALCHKCLPACLSFSMYPLCHTCFLPSSDFRLCLPYVCLPVKHSPVNPLVFTSACVPSCANLPVYSCHIPVSSVVT